MRHRLLTVPHLLLFAYRKRNIAQVVRAQKHGETSSRSVVAYHLGNLRSMKLVSFAVKNYRSITGTSKLHIREGITTLIGPNNEGKSNVLRAMVTALQIASRLDEFIFLKGGRLRG